MANCPEVEVRRVWIQRIVDHDGTASEPGGIESWLALGEALGVDRDELISERHVLPGVRYAVDAYVTFAAARAVDRGGGVVADRAVRPGRDQGAAAGAGASLPLDRSRRPRVLPHAAAAGAARRPIRARADRRALPRAATSRTRPSRRCGSRPTCSGRSWTRSTAATPSRAASRDDAGHGWSPAPACTTTRCAPSTCCCSRRGSCALNPTAVAVLELCDGEREIDAIVGTLSERYDGADVSDDVARTRAGADARRDWSSMPPPRPLTADRGAVLPLSAALPVLLEPARHRGGRLPPRARDRGLGRASSARRPQLGVLQLALTGGEPMVRRDLPQLCEAARDAGLYSSLITAGTPFTRRARSSSSAPGSTTSRSRSRAPTRPTTTGSPATGSFAQEARRRAARQASSSSR